MSDRGQSGTSGIGGIIGARVAAHLQRAVTETRVRMGPHQAAIAQRVLADFTNHVSDEIRGVMGPLWRQIADSPDAGPMVRNLARKLGTERGQAWAWVGGTATSAAMGSGLMTLLTNELQPAIGAMIRANPHIPLAPADAAAVAIRGLSWGPDMWTDAGQYGMDQNRFQAIQELQQRVLTADMVLELFRRADLDHATALRYLRRDGWDGHHAREFLSMVRRVPPGVDVAAMWNRGILSTSEALEAGRKDGYVESDMRRYLELGGEPPPLQELLLAWRRGIIDEAKVDRAIRQGPIRFEWIDTIKSLQWQPLPLGEAADAVNQGHMDVGKARRIAKEWGVRSDDFDTIIANAGLPPGLEVATEAWNRGLITEAEFETAFLESRLKNRYVPLYKALRWRVVPQETVRRLYRLGAYTRAQALTRLGHAGFSPEDARALLDAETVEATDATRELTKTEIMSLYVDRAMSEAEARAMLADLGYGDNETGWLLAIADSRRGRRYVDAVLARVRAGYVAWRLSTSAASSLMDSLEIPPDQREEMLTLWDLERLAVTRGLTVAQIQTALRRGLIDPDGAMTRLTQQGYSTEDASVLMSLAAPAPR